MGDERSTDYKVPGGRAVRIMLLWHSNYTRDTSNDAITTAKTKLARYGLGFDILPTSGVRMDTHVISSAVDQGGLISQDQYADLKRNADTAYAKLDAAPNKARLMVIFSEFKMPAKGVTIFGATQSDESYAKWNYPICLVGGVLATDKLTMLHEMGHGAGLNDYTAEASGKVNFMNDTSDNRDVMYKFQLEKIAGSFYVK
jgi:hypothetical protein